MGELELMQGAGIFWQYLPAILTAIGTIVMGWFGYNQYTKNAETDHKIEKWKQEEQNRSEKRSHDLAKIYGQLWHLLYDLDADRVYIVQPHPLINNMYLSISLEVCGNGVSAMKPLIQRMPMSEVSAFAAELAQRDFIYHTDVAEIKDAKTRSIFANNGTDMVVIKRLKNDEYDWIGSLFIEHSRAVDRQPVAYREMLNAAAESIGYILPEYK